MRFTINIIFRKFPETNLCRIKMHKHETGKNGGPRTVPDNVIVMSGLGLSPSTIMCMCVRSFSVYTSVFAQWNMG